MATSVQGDWIPNEYGGDANLQAISLLQELNWVIHHEFPGVFTMAEESTAWPGVTGKDTGQSYRLDDRYPWFSGKMVQVHSICLADTVT